MAAVALRLPRLPAWSAVLPALALLAAPLSAARAQSAADIAANPMPPGMGKPVPWQLGFQAPATDIMRQVEGFHAFVLPIMIAIVVLVAVLLIYVMIRFNHKRNPVPSRTTHNTAVEIAWTLLPILVLVFIAVPSFRLLYYKLTIPKPDLTVKITGHQWYWSYEYPDTKADVSYDSYMIPESDLKPGQERLLSVDNEMVVPMGKNIRIQVTGGDVIHSFSMPSFGIKIDAIPGRLNQAWFNVERTGIFYGQCSELCGTKHAFMPIAIRVVSPADFEKWQAQKSAELEGTPATTQVAAAPPAPAPAASVKPPAGSPAPTQIAAAAEPRPAAH